MGQVQITDTPAINERQPATTGDWIVWEQDQTSIVATNMATHAQVTITNGGGNFNPSADGDLIAWESDVAGNLDIWVHRLSVGESYAVTTDPADQDLNDVFADLLAYVDMSTGSEDIYVSTLEFVPDDEGPDIDVAPPNLDFGMVDVGDLSVGIVTITNVGDLDLTVEQVALSGDSDPVFSLLPLSLPAVVPPDGVLDVEIHFAPVTEGLVEGQLEISSDDPDSPLVTVDLVGEGVPFDDQVMQLLDEVFDPAVENGTLMGEGPGHSGPGRLGALRNMIEAAGDLIDAGFIDEACDQLLDAQNRCDGLFPPPDFVTGSSAPVLFDEIGELRSNLGCDAEDAGALRAAAPAPPDPTPSCGLGPELAVLLPMLAWWHRRRLRAQ
jgi:hypothetical protein